LGGLKEYVAWEKYTMQVVIQTVGLCQSGAVTNKMQAQTFYENAKEAVIARRTIVTVVTIRIAFIRR